MKNIVITILAVLVFGLGVYIVADKMLENKKTESNEPTNTTTEENNDVTEEYNDFISESTYVTKLKNETYTVDVDVSKYNNIFEYIEKQDNVSIEVNYCTQEDYNGSYNYSGKYKFTESEVATILSEMKQSTRLTESGFGGACVPTVKISYSRKNVPKHVSFYSIYFINETNDGNVYKIYENNLDSIEEYPIYGFDNLSATLKNKLTEIAKRY